MDFKESLKAKAPRKVLLIVEDCLMKKIPYFLKSIQERENGKKVLEIDEGNGKKTDLEVMICEASEDVQDVIWDREVEIAVAILDCGLPKRKGDIVLDTVLKLLEDNNKRKYPKSKSVTRVMPDFKDEKGVVH